MENRFQVVALIVVMGSAFVYQGTFLKRPKVSFALFHHLVPLLMIFLSYFLIRWGVGKRFWWEDLGYLIAFFLMVVHRRSLFEKLMRLVKGPLLRPILFFVLTLAAGELGLRLAGHFYVRDSYQEAFGKPFDKHQNTILCLGESSTIGLWVKKEESYPALLEQKLRAYYGNDKLQVIIPAHLGQNSSVISDRFSSYLSRFNPKAVVLMVGANNQWALGKSHIRRHLSQSERAALETTLLLTLSDFRLFKVARHFYLALTGQAVSPPSEVLGESTFWPFPPKRAITAFGHAKKEAFVRMWEKDVEQMIRLSKERGVPVILMTYAAPVYVSKSKFVKMARQNRVSLVRNDFLFEKLLEKHALEDYFFSDRWHPNARGYRVMAELVFQTFLREKILESAS